METANTNVFQLLKNNTLFLLFGLAIGSFASSVSAQVQIEVKTKFDHYAVTQNAGSWTLAGQKIRTEALKPLLEVVEQKAESPCANNKLQSDISLKISRSQNPAETRILDIQNGVIKGPSGCLLISGPGLNEFPLHRSWLVGPFQNTIALKGSFQVLDGDRTLVSLVQKNSQWVNTSENPEFNWDFFERFEKSLKEFPIEKRYALASGKGKPTRIVIANGVKYRFVQLAPRVWGVVHSNFPWIETSSYWAEWFELSSAQWTDRNASTMRFFKDTSKPASERRAQIESLGGIWNQNLQNSFQYCLNNSEEDMELRLYCADRLRSKPTVASISAFVDLINATEDEALLKKAESALRIKNPKGAKLGQGLGAFREYWNKWNREKNH